jgi:hypothetical protein
MSCSPHLPRVDHSNYTWRRLQVTNILSSYPPVASSLPAPDILFTEQYLLICSYYGAYEFGPTLSLPHFIFIPGSRTHTRAYHALNIYYFTTL